MNNFKNTINKKLSNFNKIYQKITFNKNKFRFFNFINKLLYPHKLPIFSVFLLFSPLPFIIFFYMEDIVKNHSIPIGEAVSLLFFKSIFCSFLLLVLFFILKVSLKKILFTNSFNNTEKTILEKVGIEYFLENNIKDDDFLIRSLYNFNKKQILYSYEELIELIISNKNIDNNTIFLKYLKTQLIISFKENYISKEEFISKIDYSLDKLSIKDKNIIKSTYSEVKELTEFNQNFSFENLKSSQNIMF